MNFKHKYMIVHEPNSAFREVLAFADTKKEVEAMYVDILAEEGCDQADLSVFEINKKEVEMKVKLEK